MRNHEPNYRVSDNTLQLLKAAASPVRMAILEYLKHPAEHFPPQKDGDFKADGVCADFIRDRLGIAAATASRHLTLLTNAGLLIATRKKGWTFYRRDDAAIRNFGQRLQSSL
ncbi:MAG: helix-turn-helix transcriptional regulator [Gemmatimonadaceae bacterium]|nr:helix-turn-helix transcriptional regulator [Gemmatimonadaceae bacterium]